MAQDIILKPGKPAPYSYTALGLDIPHDSPDLRNFEISHALIDVHKYKPADSIREFVSKHGITVAGNHLGTEGIAKQFEADIDEAKGREGSMDMLTVVCPPYHKDRLHSRKNVGLFGNFTDDPLDKNFMFDYKIILHDMFFIAQEVARLKGVNLRSKYIVSDWALRDVAGILDGLKDTKTITDTLQKFICTGREYAKNLYPDVDIDIVGYTDVGLEKKLPFCMPMTPEEKEAYVLNLAMRKFPGVSDVNRQLLEVILMEYQSDHGVRLFEACSDTSKWENLQEEFPDILAAIDDHVFAKSFLIDFLRLMRNTRVGRQSEGPGIDAEKAGFYDAMVKAHEYLIMGEHLAETFPGAWNFSWDTKFPASGHFYSKGGLRTLFIDPGRIPTPMSRLGSKVNPF